MSLVRLSTAPSARIGLLASLAYPSAGDPREEEKASHDETASKEGCPHH